MSDTENQDNTNVSQLQSESTKMINDRKCFKYKNKWVPANDEGYENDRFIEFLKHYENAPDYEDMVRLGKQYNYLVDDPYEMFLLGYVTYGKNNREDKDEIRKLQREIATAQANALEAKKNADGWSKEASEWRQKYADLEAFYSNVDNNPEVLKTLAQKNADVVRLQGLLEQAQAMIENNKLDAQNQYNQIVMQKDTDLINQKQQYMMEFYRQNQTHLTELGKKDERIMELHDKLNQAIEELDKAKNNAMNGALSIRDRTFQEKLQLADNLAKFKRAAWSLLERVLLSYDNTLAFIDKVHTAVRDCQNMMTGMWNDAGMITARFNTVPTPNISEDKEAVKQFKKEYLQDIDQEFDRVRRRYQWNPSNNESSLNSYESSQMSCSDQSE